VIQSGPQRLQLSTELKQLREQAKLTQQRVAERLDWSQSKVIRIEQGTVRVQVTDLMALLNLYEVTDQATVELLTQRARDSKRLPFTEYRNAISPETLQYFQLEVGASIIRHVALNVVPGTMQTDAYARAIFKAYEVPSAQADRLLDSRRERRKMLDRAKPPEIFVLIDEAALRRAVGGPGVMAEQIDHLLQLSTRQHITLQVLPFAVGAHAALRRSFTHLEFSTLDAPGAIYIENSLGDMLFEDNPAVTQTYRLRFQDLERLASPPADFEKFVSPLT
jgi:transcriptional regulator with XRE-family HTH domain